MPGEGGTFADKNCAYKWMKILTISHLGWKGFAYLEGKPPSSPLLTGQDKTHKSEVEKTSTVESYALDAG